MSHDHEVIAGLVASVNGVNVRLDMTRPHVVEAVAYATAIDLLLQAVMEQLTNAVRAQAEGRPVELDAEGYAMLAREYLQLQNSHGAHITKSIQKQFEYVGRAFKPEEQGGTQRPDPS